MVASRNSPSTRRRAGRSHQASVEDPRAYLLAAVARFVRRARKIEGPRRISLLGSLTTAKPQPKDADVLVLLAPELDLAALAAAARQLQGHAQSANLGADIFLASEDHRYIGRICPWRECLPRAACRARHCGLRPHLNDDLDVITLEPDLIRHPPLDLWPEITRRSELPKDVEALLLAGLR